MNRFRYVAVLAAAVLLAACHRGDSWPMQPGEPPNEKLQALLTKPIGQPGEISFMRLVERSDEIEGAMRRDSRRDFEILRAILAIGGGQKISMGGGSVDAISLSISTALPKYGPRIVPFMIEDLKNGNANQRFWSATVLRGLGADARDALPALQEALKDKDGAVQRASQGAIDGIQEAINRK